MKTKRLLGFAAMTLLLSSAAMAQNNGGIDEKMLNELKESYVPARTFTELASITFCSAFSAPAGT